MLMKIEFLKIKVADELLKDIKGYHIYVRSPSDSYVARLSRISILGGFSITEIARFSFFGTLNVLEAARRQC